MGLNVVTYNVGRDEDWVMVCLKEGEPVPQDRAELFRKRDGIAKEAFRRLREQMRPDVEGNESAKTL